MTMVYKQFLSRDPSAASQTESTTNFFFYSLYYRTEISNVSVKKQQGGEKREQVGYRRARILLPVESSAVHQNSRGFLPPLSQPY